MKIQQKKKKTNEKIFLNRKTSKNFMLQNIHSGYTKEILIGKYLHNKAIFSAQKNSADSFFFKPQASEIEMQLKWNWNAIEIVINKNSVKLFDFKLQKF